MILSSRRLAAQTANAVALLQPAVDGKPIVALTRSVAALGLLAYAAPVLEVPLLLLDPDLPESVLAHLLERTGAGLIAGDREIAGYRFLPAETLIDSSPQLSPESGSLPFPVSEQVAVMVATSGSSGQPKAVMLTGRNLLAAAKASNACTSLQSGDRWLACLPLFHIGGYSILYRCAWAGAEALLLPKFDAGEIWQALANEGISHLSLVPSMLAQLLEVSTAAPPASLRHVLVGGAALSGELAERAVHCGWPLQPTYGMSETASQIATLPQLTLPWRPGWLGKPLPGVELALHDDGRLKIRGPMVMAGYANPALQPGDGLQEGWFITGDLAEISPEGELHILGRADEVIVSGGKKIHPQQVENEVVRCPGVTGAAAIGLPDAVWGQVVTVVFSGTLPAEELLDWCRDHIAGAHRPRRAIQVPALPLLANGKPDRRALCEMLEKLQTESGQVS